MVPKSTFSCSVGPAVSVDDTHFIDIVSNGIEKVEGKYEMPLPLKDSNLNLPNNKAMALHRSNALKRRLEKGQKYKSHYLTFMDAMLKHGHAEKVQNHLFGMNRATPGIYLITGYTTH